MTQDEATGVAVLYRRVSTNEQGLGLAGQRERLLAEAGRRGWPHVEEITDEGVSGSVDAAKRPALGPVLDAMREGVVLAFAKLDRLSRSMLDFAGLLDRSEREGWRLVCLDPEIDTTTTNGRLVAHVLMAVAEWERDTIGERVKEGLAQSPKRLGRAPGLPPVGGAVAAPVPPEVAHAAASQREGKTLAQLADCLNAQGHKSPRGKRWHATSVKRLLDRLDAA